jgi:hypothetical protein
MLTLVREEVKLRVWGVREKRRKWTFGEFTRPAK